MVIVMLARRSKSAPYGGQGACSPRRFLDFRPSEIIAGAMLGEILGALGPPRLLHLPVRKPLVAQLYVRTR